MPQRPSGKIRPANGNGNVHLLYVVPRAAAGPLGMRESPSQSSMEMRLLACAINWLQPGQGERDQARANRMGAPDEAAEICGRRTASQRPYFSTRASTRLMLEAQHTRLCAHQFESKSVITHTFNITCHSHAVNVDIAARHRAHLICTHINSSIIYFCHQRTRGIVSAVPPPHVALHLGLPGFEATACRPELESNFSPRTPIEATCCGRDPSQRRGCRF